MITREKENRSLGNHHYGTTEREYWNFHGKLLFITSTNSYSTWSELWELSVPVPR